MNSVRKASLLEVKKKKLLKTSIRLFRKEGFYNVSIEELVRAADTSIATFYNCFSAKEELVCTYRNERLAACQKFYRLLREDAAFADCDARFLLREFLAYVLNLLNSVGLDFNRIFAQRRLKECDNRPEDKPYLPAIAELIALGQQQQVMRRDFTVPQLTELTDRFLLGLCLGWQLYGEELNLPDFGAEALAGFCAMLAPEQARPLPPGPPLHDVWQTALYMLIPDPRSGIKQLEEDWLHRFNRGQ